MRGTGPPRRRTGRRGGGDRGGRQRPTAAAAGRRPAPRACTGCAASGRAEIENEARHAERWVRDRPSTHTTRSIRASSPLSRRSLVHIDRYVLRALSQTHPGLCLNLECCMQAIQHAPSFIVLPGWSSSRCGEAPGCTAGSPTSRPLANRARMARKSCIHHPSPAHPMWESTADDRDTSLCVHHGPTAQPLDPVEGVAATTNATPAAAAAATGHRQQPRRRRRQLPVVNGGGA